MKFKIISLKYTILNKFVLAGGRFMPESHLRQTKLTYNVCGPFTKHRERIKKFKEKEDLNYIYTNEL